MLKQNYTQNMHTDPTTSEKSGKPEYFHDYETSEKGNKMAIYFLNMNEIS